MEIKRMNQGYEIIHSLSIGETEIVMGENLNNPATPYVTWQANDRGYDWGHYNASYPVALMDWAQRVHDASNEYRLNLRTKECVNALFIAGDCISGSRELDYTNKIVVISPSAMKLECRTASRQLWLATGGFGCDPASSGRAVFCTNLLDHREARWNRQDILGVIRPERIPQWAKESVDRLAKKEKGTVEPER